MRAHIWVLRELEVALRGLSKVCWLIQFIKYELDDVVCRKERQTSKGALGEQVGSEGRTTEAVHEAANSVVGVMYATKDDLAGIKYDIDDGDGGGTGSWLGASEGRREDGGRRLGNRARLYKPLARHEATPDSDPLPISRARHLVFPFRPPLSSQRLGLKGTATQVQQISVNVSSQRCSEGTLVVATPHSPRKPPVARPQPRVECIKIHLLQALQERPDRNLLIPNQKNVHHRAHITSSFPISEAKKICRLTPPANTGIATRGTFPPLSLNISRAVIKWSFATVANSYTALSIPAAAGPFRNTSSWLTLCLAVISAGMTIRFLETW